MQALADAAPKLTDYLDEAAITHFNGVKQRLDAAGVAYTVNPRLVRGFDYYNRTVFEFIAKGSDWELTIAGGGRYDGLFAELGGKPAPSCGFGIGVERVMMALQEAAPASIDALDAYVVYAVETQDAAWVTAERLRDHGLRVAVHGTSDGATASFKSQMKKADGSGARFAIIMGSDEVAQSMLSLKDLRGGAQQLMAIDDAASLMMNARSIF
jgi:histidyl-tRNA synthetase